MAVSVPVAGAPAITEQKMARWTGALARARASWMQIPFLVSAALLSVCVGLVVAIERREHIETDFSSAGEQGVGGGEALRMLRSSPRTGSFRPMGRCGGPTCRR